MKKPYHKPELNTYCVPAYCDAGNINTASKIESSEELLGKDREYEEDNEAFNVTNGEGMATLQQSLVSLSPIPSPAPTAAGRCAGRDERRKERSECEDEANPRTRSAFFGPCTSGKYWRTGKKRTYSECCLWCMERHVQAVVKR